MDPNPFSIQALLPVAIEQSLSDDPEQQRLGRDGLSLVARMSEAQELEREKGRNPVGFLLKRFDFSGAPIEIWLEQSMSCREECRLFWRTPAVSRYVNNGDGLSCRVERTEAARMAFGFAISERVAFESPEDAVRMISAWAERNVGFRPRALTELQLFRKLRPECSAEGL